eukprot:TRINITY_DN27196_c0_g1_i1.p1 TRINITY_DN27196_c0_g1~~TRINITY_DN27196_c0_g1_i1.p1  ORF type:complete len:177 (+),score=7.60 TRINITY_DN27196_c0_g1_i1:95-625(+)
MATRAAVHVLLWCSIVEATRVGPSDSSSARLATIVNKSSESVNELSESLLETNGTLGSCNPWRAYSGMFGAFSKYWYQRQICTVCDKSGDGLDRCGSRGNRATGKYGYGSDGSCKNSHGCRCFESRQSGNANTGMTMMSSCSQHEVKTYKICCDAGYKKCNVCTSNACNNVPDCAR